MFFLTIMAPPPPTPIVFLESLELMCFGKLLVGRYPIHIQPLHKLFLFQFSIHSPVNSVSDCTAYKGPLETGLTAAHLFCLCFSNSQNFGSSSLSSVLLAGGWAVTPCLPKVAGTQAGWQGRVLLSRPYFKIEKGLISFSFDDVVLASVEVPSVASLGLSMGCSAPLGDPGSWAPLGLDGTWLRISGSVPPGVWVVFLPVGSLQGFSSGVVTNQNLNQACCNFSVFQPGLYDVLCIVWEFARIHLPTTQPCSPSEHNYFTTSRFFFFFYWSLQVFYLLLSHLRIISLNFSSFINISS